MREKIKILQNEIEILRSKVNSKNRYEFFVVYERALSQNYELENVIELLSFKTYVSIWLQ